MSEFYRKADILAIITEMRSVAENAFYSQGAEPGEESDKLKGYGTAINGFVQRLRQLDTKKPIKVVK